MDLVLRLANAVHWVLLDDAEYYSVSENAAEEPYRTCRRASAASHDGAAPQLVGLDVRPGLARHDVFHGLGSI